MSTATSSLATPRSSAEVVSPILRERHLLTGPGAEREIHHLSLDFGHPAATAEFAPGDCLAIYPQNRRAIATALIAALADGASNAPIIDGRLGEQLALGEYLTHRANLRACSPSLVCALQERLASGDLGKEVLSRLCQEPNQRPYLVQFCRARSPLELLRAHPRVLSAQQLCDHLSPLLPRLYSIASAPQVHPGVIDLTVSYTSADDEDPNLGVCSHWLCRDLQLGAPTRAHHHRHPGFYPPENSGADLIMVGAGTGIAPFRAFLQQRQLESARGASWMLMGQRRSSDFLYRELLEGLVAAGKLQLNVAFSREARERPYVTHLMWDEREQLMRRMQGGAHLYVCGSIALGKSVQEVLVKMLRSEGVQTDQRAVEILRGWRKEGRYRRDVY